MSNPKISDYEIREKLGCGSYATVYKAKHKKSQTSHAIKCVEKSSLSGSSTDNLIREIELLKSLSHKYIVKLDDFFWDDKNIYIVLEYCDAGNLLTFIRQRQVLPENICKYFLRHLALAVQYMRENNVSHFDLKPQNLLLTRNPNVILKVADFGFAQYLKLNEKNSCIKGSPLYMAPEVVLKHNYDAKADLWSIGVILFECLFGKPPYKSKSLEELLTKIKKQEKIVLPTNAKISSECEDLLTRLLQHDPDKRITFQEFFDHPFLDLKHIPSKQNLQKAIQIVTNAVQEDEKQNYEEAYHLYCTALQYFVPFITEETDAVKKQTLRARTNTYLNRAEEIKSTVLSKRQATKTTLSPGQQKLANILEPSSRYKQLCIKFCSYFPHVTKFELLNLDSLSSSSPAIQNALEIGRQAEMYMYEKRLDVALDTFKSALNILIPIINKETSGERKTILHQQVMEWLQEAESIKSLLSAKVIKDEPLNIYNCLLQ